MISDGAKINLFIVGAAKAGTDTVRDWLNQCPDAFVLGPEEPNYFCTDHLRHAKPSDYWINRIVAAGRGHTVVGEKSTWYLPSTAATHNAKSYNPDARIVILYRDHATLVTSLHGEFLKIGVEDLTDLDDAWSATIEDPNRLVFPNSFLTDYASACMIGTHSNRWIDAFGHEQTLLMKVGDLENAAGRQRLAQFLGLTDFPDIAPSRRNQSLKARPMARWLYSLRANALRLRGRAKRILRPSASTATLKGKVGQVATTHNNSQALRKIAEHFAKDAVLLEQLVRQNKAIHR